MPTFARRLGIATISLALGLGILPILAQDSVGFDGYIQSGTCDAPTDDIHLSIGRGEDDHAFLPYTVEGNDADTAPVFFGERQVPGFSPLSLLGDTPFSLVVTDANESPVACGDILMPTNRTFIDQGLILVNLQESNDSGMSGVAILRAPDEGDAQELTTAEVLIVQGEASAATPVVEATPNA